MQLFSCSVSGLCFTLQEESIFCWSVSTVVCFLYCGDPNAIHLIFIEVILHLTMRLEFRGLVPLEIMNVVNQMSCYRCVNTVFCDFLK